MMWEKQLGSIDRRMRTDEFVLEGNLLTRSVQEGITGKVCTLDDTRSSHRDEAMSKLAIETG